MAVDATRTIARNDQPARPGPVVYWMQRDQRAEDNWALLYAQEQALLAESPVYVVFNLVPTYGGASFRQYDFMLRGLEEAAQQLREHNIAFHLLQGDPTETVPAFLAEVGAGQLVVDFNPLEPARGWKAAVAARVSVLVTEVDGHNIVPCWLASEKEEFAAHTFRPKVHRQLRQYLTDFPELLWHPQSGVAANEPEWDALRAAVRADRSVPPVDWLVPGSFAAKDRVRAFISDRLDRYAGDRNDPTIDGQSDLSPYLHFGQLSAQWVAYQVQKAYDTDKASREAFLEELIVRRELADNYCFYNQRYNQVAGAHAWAQKTIAEHAGDEREYLYTTAELEAGNTHDALWNVMQRQLVQKGKLHGWCRMYWAKKVLEWTPDVQDAIDSALYLNDKYSLDGNDPNGVVGVMWSIVGVHDRAWNERPIFGKIRYMNYAGARRKFDVDAYISQHTKEETLFDE